MGLCGGPRMVRIDWAVAGKASKQCRRVVDSGRSVEEAEALLVAGSRMEAALGRSTGPTGADLGPSYSAGGHGGRWI